MSKLREKELKDGEKKVLNFQIVSYSAQQLIC